LQGARRRVGQDPALVQRHDTIGVAEHDVHVVLDLDDGLDAHPRRCLHQHFHDRVLVTGAHAAGRLVQQDQLGRSAKALATSSSFLSPCGQRARRPAEAGAQTEQLGHRRDASHTSRSPASAPNRRAPRPRRATDGHRDRLADGEPGKHVDELEGARPGRAGQPHGVGAAHVLALEAHRAAAGATEPVSTLTSVVLPAPLGPTIETNWPAGIASVTPSSAVNVPYSFRTPTASSSIRPRARLRASSRPQQPTRDEDHEHGQDGAEHEAPVGGQRHHRILKEDEDDGAHHRAQEVVEATEQQHEDQVAGVGPVGQQRIGEPGRDRQQRAAHRPEHGRDDEGAETVPPGAHAERLGLGGILADGAQGTARTASGRCGA
jgi:hypothetical protein